MASLAGRVAVVTGAAGTLGQATVQRFMECGASTIAVARSFTQPETIPEATDHISCDLTEERSAQKAFADIAEKHGRIDILANIAGGFVMGPRIEETTADDWTTMLNINAVTAWLACKYALPFMRAQNFGRIVNIGARAARKPSARMAPYCVSKAAVVALTEVLALECIDTGVTANCILPGTIDTPRNRASMPDADHSRWVPPKDLATTIIHLSDPDSRSINGAIIPVYGRS